MKQSKRRNVNAPNSFLLYFFILLVGVMIGIKVVSTNPKILQVSGDNAIAATEADTTPPQVAITYPTNKTRISPNSTVEITATASDNIGVQLVDFHVSVVTKVGGRKVTINRIHQCLDETTPYSCTWVVPSGHNVTYLIDAVASDLAGNNGISKYVEFTVR